MIGAEVFALDQSLVFLLSYVAFLIGFALLNECKGRLAKILDEITEFFIVDMSPTEAMFCFFGTVSGWILMGVGVFGIFYALFL